MLKNITLLNNFHNKLLLIESFVSFAFFILVTIINNVIYQYYLGVFDICFIYVMTLVKLIKYKDVSIIEIFLCFLFLYVIGSYIFFNNTAFMKVLKAVFLLDLRGLTNKSILYINLNLYIYTKILSVPFLYFKYKNVIKSLDIGTTYDNFVPIYFSFFLLYLFYLSRTYTNYSNFIEESGPATVLIAYGSIFGSVLFLLTNSNYFWYEKKIPTLLLLVCMLLVAKIGSRGYAIMLFFTLITNLKKRGLKMGNKVIVYLCVGVLFLILYQGLSRIGLKGLNTSYNLLTLFAEFFIPAFSIYYFLVNPLDVNLYLSSRDFIFRLLPTSMMPELSINKFIGIYHINGIEVAPAGGFFFYGQLFFYFNINTVFILFFLAIFLIKFKYEIEYRKITLISIFMPMYIYLIPRQLLCLAPRVTLMEVILFLIFILFTSPIKRFKINKEVGVLYG